jgi:hypothetical protein
MIPPNQKNFKEDLFRFIGDAFYKAPEVLHHFALKTPKWQRYLHSFTPTKWAF